MEEKNAEKRQGREERKPIEVPKLENPSTLEDYISQLILAVLPLCPYNAISQGSVLEGERISKNTIKNHLSQGRIPPDSFDKYVRAFKQLKRLDVKLDDGQKFSDSKFVAMRKFIEVYCDILECINESYKAMKGFPYYLISDRIKNWDFAKEYSQDFWYFLNKCFEAFCTVDYFDFLFLSKFFRCDKPERELIMERMEGERVVPYSDIVETLLNGEGNLWINAHKECSSEAEKKTSKEQNWEIFNQKIKKMTTVRGINKETNQIAFKAVGLNGFLSLIWPKEGETDTNFGTKEIEALIVFKYFLTKEAQQNLLEELKIDYT